MAELILSEGNFDSEVIKSNLPVLVDFWAPWCGPCRMLSPVIEEIAMEFAGKIKVGKLNTDENLALATQYQITSIPTIMIFKGGKVVEKMVGFKSKNELKKIVEGTIQ
jgi:thioredoxin 1